MPTPHPRMDFWAKTSPTEDYLPVATHLLDAGSVALRLFDVALGDAQRAWFARGFDVDVARVRDLVAFVAAAHDVGKVSPFQHAVPALAERLGTIALPGFLQPHRFRHDAIGGLALQHYVRSRGGSRQLAAALCAVVAGHHSVPRKPERGTEGATGVWAEHQEAMLDRLEAAYAVGDFAEFGAPSRAVALALAGLVNVSDWTASDASRFPVTSAPSRDVASVLAQRAIVPVAWRPRPVAPAGSFESVFGFKPRAVQRAVDELVTTLDGPALLLIEDRTGSGKTEAALWVARAALEQGARGLYVGLPTRATSDQFHRRAQDFLDRVLEGGADDVRLLHGGAHLAATTDVSPDALGDGADDELSLARSWFAGRRRGLLAPYAVGTVDQALLAVLAARFYPVRVAGVMGKVVVIDEVHALDSYATHLLTNLVRWLAALECTVVALSATLPQSLRQDLTGAFLEGRGTTSGGALARTSYPRVTVASDRTATTVSVEDDRPSRRVLIESAVCTEPADVVALVQAEIADGSCLAVVCNTVKLAQQRFLALREALDDTIQLLLLHARMRPLERSPVESRLFAALGPPGPNVARPPRMVVVATQVIEQSLDIDFDVMLTDLAPIDLLIQRAGRVHRHTGRTRGSRHEKPRVVVLDAEGASVTRPLEGATEAIYGGATLVRTRAALRGRAAIEEPGDLDTLIEAVAGTALPSGLSPAESERLEELDDERQHQVRTFVAWAEHNGIGRPADSEVAARAAPVLADEDEVARTADNTAMTRWSDRPSASVVVLSAQEGHLVDGPLDRSATRELLLRSVSVSHPKVVTSALRHEPPAAWRRSGALRRHALSVSGDPETLNLDWDPVLGVSI